MSQIPSDQLQALKDANPCNAVAEKWVRLKPYKGHWQGRCPLCSAKQGKPGGTEFEAWDDHWCCAACESGGDVLRLVMLVEGVDFRTAIERLGGAREVDAEAAARRQAELDAVRAKRDRESANYREAERANLWRMWCEAPRTVTGTAAEAYLALRGVAVPPTMRLRCAEEQPYYVAGDKPGAWRCVHTGPAMLAPLIGRDGKFAGLHFTYIDLKNPKGKVALAHPDDGAPLPAKKVRGSKKGARIVLWEPIHPLGEKLNNESMPIEQLILGEGIEKTAAVWMALQDSGRDLSRTAFWIAGDIGNMGGKSAGSVTHPDLKTDKGRARRVPGPDPDPEDPGIPIPDSVTDLVLLGDSTSDRFTTECAMYRAFQRYQREGRQVRVFWAPAGQDFDDVARETA